MSIVLIRGDRGWLMHILVFLIYLVSGKTHFDNCYYHVNADFYRVKKPVRQIFLNMLTVYIVKKKKRRLWEKRGVQNKIVLDPNSCYIDACYNEVDLYRSVTECRLAS